MSVKIAYSMDNAVARDIVSIVKLYGGGSHDVETGELVDTPQHTPNYCKILERTDLSPSALSYFVLQTLTHQDPAPVINIIRHPGGWELQAWHNKDQTPTRMDVDDLFQHILTEGGITYDVVTGDQPGYGYAVGIYKERELGVPVATATPELLLEWIFDNLDLLSHSLVYIGAWVEDEDVDTPTLWLDPTWVTASIDRAMALAIEQNQRAIYDLFEKKSIYVEDVVDPEDLQQEFEEVWSVVGNDALTRLEEITDEDLDAAFAEVYGEEKGVA